MALPLVGAASEQDANALADRLRAELGPGARVEVRAAVDMPSPAFVLLEALKPGIARDLGL